MKKLLWVLFGVLLCYIPPVEAHLENMSALNATCSVAVQPQSGVAFFELTGTWSGTVTFEGTMDKATTYVAFSGVNRVTGAIASTATANGNWVVSATGWTAVRMRFTAYTSGTLAAHCDYSPDGASFVTSSSLGQQTMALSAPVTIASDQAAIPVTVSGTGTTNVTQFGGTNVSTGTGAGGAGIPRVTVSNDSSVLTSTPDATTAATVLSAACTSQGTCGATTALAIPIAGLQGATLIVTAHAGTPALTLLCDTSSNGGVTYDLGTCTFRFPATNGSLGGYLATLVNPSESPPVGYAIGWEVSATHIRVRVNPYSSGSVTVAVYGTYGQPSIPFWVGTAGASAIPTDANGNVLGSVQLHVDETTGTTGRAVRSDSVGNTTVTLRNSASTVAALVTTTNTTAAAAGLEVMACTAASGITAATVGRATTPTTDSANGSLNVRITDSATYLSPQVGGTNALAGASGMSVLPAFSIATPAAVTAARSQMLQTNTTNNALDVGLVGTSTTRITSATDNSTGAATGIQVMGSKYLTAPTAGTSTDLALLQQDAATGGLFSVPIPTTAAGAAMSQAVISANTTTGIKASAGNIYGVVATTSAATVCYIQFYNSNAPTCGTSVIFSLPIQATSLPMTQVMSTIPLANFSTGIGTCTSTTATGSTTCTGTVSATIIFK